MELGGELRFLVVALVSKSAQPTRSPVWSLTYSRSLPYLRHRGAVKLEVSVMRPRWALELPLAGGCWTALVLSSELP